MKVFITNYLSSTLNYDEVQCVNLKDRFIGSIGFLPKHMEYYLSVTEGKLHLTFKQGAKIAIQITNSFFLCKNDEIYIITDHFCVL